MLYRVARFFLWVFLRVAFRMEVTGVENCPRNGPVIAVANHVSMLDPIVLGCALPRPVYFMAKYELFRNPLFGWLLRHVGAFPVRRGEQDLKAFRRSMEVLGEGKVLGMFPEGTRSSDGVIRKAFSGATILAQKSGAPILPVGIRGTLRLTLFSKIMVEIGKPIWFSGTDETTQREGLQTRNARIVNALRELVRGSGSTLSGE